MGTEVPRLETETPRRAPSNRPPFVDLVFAGEPPGQARRILAGSGLVLAAYIVALAFMSRLGRSAGPWSGEMAARVHDAISMERAVEIAPPTPPAVEPPPSPAPRTAPAPRSARAASPRSRPAPPAQAGQLAAVAPAPLDFTGSAFVVGSGATYAGGTTTSSGTSRTPGSGNVATAGGPAGPPAARSRARPVSLDQAAWNCPWPAEADARQVDEETVVLRVGVRSDGRAERVEVVSDPGFGFGAAARQCALTTRFEPARDPAGRATSALSPPIRVHFFR